MVNVNKHIAYWRQSAEEDWEVADQLISTNKIRQGLFFLHLTLEKILKAHVCRNTGDIAPRLHNLVRLSELSGINFDRIQKEFLAEINPFNIAGRYPEMWDVIPSEEEAKELKHKAEELFKWLKNQL